MALNSWLTCPSHLGQSVTMISDLPENGVYSHFLLHLNYKPSCTWSSPGSTRGATTATMLMRQLWLRGAARDQGHTTGGQWCQMWTRHLTGHPRTFTSDWANGSGWNDLKEEWCHMQTCVPGTRSLTRKWSQHYSSFLSGLIFLQSHKKQSQTNYVHEFQIY